ncbi:hypothetical protein HDU78_002483 [Chytriomyces hyalinus]|nr:hypothetical protein HDU78_002483 [Chytriomyces hyalinus]
MEESQSGEQYDANQYVVHTPQAIVDKQTKNAETPVDTSVADAQAWLVKVPKFVKERWDSVAAAGQPGIELGYIRVYNDPPPKPAPIVQPMRTSGPSSLSKYPSALPPAQLQAKPPPPQRITLHLPKDAAWAETIPKNYQLRINPTDSINSSVFVTTEAQDAVTAFAATVFRDAVVTPVMDDQYREIMKQRQLTESNKRKSVELLGNKDAKNARRIQSTLGGDVSRSVINISKSELARTTGNFKDLEKRERMPRQDLIEILINLFNEHHYWSLKNLMERTAQPQTWLKEVLSEVAVIVRKGNYNGLYELKSELQAVAGDDEEEKPQDF